MDEKPDLEQVVNRLLAEVRQKNVQLSAVREEVNRANRDYEKLTLPGAVRNMRLKLHEVEKENRLLKKELDKIIHREK